MMARTIRHALRPVTLGLAILAPTLPAQGAAGATWFLTGGADVPGGSAQTGQYVLRATFGPSPSVARAVSTTYAVEGGFVAGVDTVAGTVPWITAITPSFATMRGGAALIVHGTGLVQGTLPQLTIGGAAAAVGSRTQSAITTSLPVQPVPGWQPVTLTTSAGTTTLAHGVGVLPMIEAEPAIGLGTRADLVYRGRQGDVMVWCLALAPSPITIPFAGLGHGLAIDAGTLFTTATFVVSQASGEVRLRVPPLTASVPFWVQGLALSSDPGFAPGSFTNVVRVF